MQLAPCQKRGQGGQCHQCVDHMGGGASIDLWDCKTPSDPQINKQIWTYDPSELKIKKIKKKKERKKEREREREKILNILCSRRV